MSKSLLVAASLLTGLASIPLSADGGAIRIEADLTEAPRRILHAHLSLPVEPGPLALLYPQWIPGEHGPTGPISDLAGLRMTAGGEALAWTRDPVDMFTFHVAVPDGVERLEIDLDYLVPSGRGVYTAGPATSDELAVLSWNNVLLYPAGPASDDIVYEPSLRVPDGWEYATALDPVGEEHGTIRFSPVSLTTLVDSPIATGRHHRVIDLGVVDGVPHRFHVVADSARDLEVDAASQAGLRGLVREALALFGARHYDAYDFLVVFSDQVAHFGLEHHESSDNRLEASVLFDPVTRLDALDLFAHEYVHSWNAKFRRPAGLTTPAYQTPMVGDLLWVYEGLTTYLGEILSPRSGLWTPEFFREYLATTAAELDHHPGRSWRPLADTARGAQVTYGTRSEWSSWRRPVDFYREGLLVWLEADLTIRRVTGGERSLDDFCRRFFGGESGPPRVEPFTYEELLAELGTVAEHDWDRFFTERIEEIRLHPPLEAIAESGWRLVYTAESNHQVTSSETRSDRVDHRDSLGMTIFTKPRHAEHGTIEDVIPGMPAAEAGLAPGMTLVAVNGRRWSPDLLRIALEEAAAEGGVTTLLATNGDVFHTFEVHYDGGPRYPHLVRDESRPDVLSAIIAPRTAAP